MSGCVFLRGDKIRHSFQSPVVKARQHMDQAAEGNKQATPICLCKKRGRENELGVEVQARSPECFSALLTARLH